jgi:hypothetical protein
MGRIPLMQSVPGMPVPIKRCNSWNVALFLAPPGATVTALPQLRWQTGGASLHQPVSPALAKATLLCTKISLRGVMKKKEEERCPAGEEKPVFGRFKDFNEFQIEKQMELLQDLLIKLNEKSETDKRGAERFDNLLAEICEEFIRLQNFIHMRSG